MQLKTMIHLNLLYSSSIRCPFWALSIFFVILHFPHGKAINAAFAHQQQ
jgi:hypothetical protein